MAKIKSVKNCRTYSEVERAVRSQKGLIIKNKKGVKIYGKRTKKVYAELHNNHKSDIPTGTFCALVKVLLRLGFVAIPLAWIWSLL